jgi:DNA-binding NtrC family response regulator
VFLDDIDDVPLSMQVKLLRVLQNRVVERVGGVKAIPIDVRVVAGAKRDLEGLVAEGTFRQDLYYRLNVIPMALPPLRERRDDIPALMDHFLGRFFRQRGEPVPPIPSAIRNAFMWYSWPGNVRELENLCERMALTCTDGRLDAQYLPAAMLQAGAEASRDGDHLTLSPEPAPAAPWPANNELSPVSLDDRLRGFETNLISWALRVTAGNKSRAAKLLKIKRSTLGDRMTRCGLKVKDVTDESRRLRASA